MVTSSDPFNDTFCQFQGYIAIALAVASIYTLVLMAVNRYYRIVKPAKYLRYFTKKKTTIMILVSWSSALRAPLPYFLSGHKMVSILLSSSVFLKSLPLWEFRAQCVKGFHVQPFFIATLESSRQFATTITTFISLETQ